MEIKGRIIRALPAQRGVSKSGNQWSKQMFVLATLENYPKKVAFDLFGDKLAQFAQLCTPGAVVTVSFDIESREFNGRWYTDIRAWKVELDEFQPEPQPQALPQPAPATATEKAVAYMHAATRSAVPQEMPAVSTTIGTGEVDELPF